MAYPQHLHLDEPIDLAVDTAGNLYIADNGNELIRMVAPDGTISTIASGIVEDNSAVASQAELSLFPAVRGFS